MAGDNCEHLAVGDLVLHRQTRELAGPVASVPLAPGPYRLLRSLMLQPGVVVELREIIKACWPDPDFRPDDAPLCVRSLVLYARIAMEKAGVERKLLRSLGKVGYALDGAPRVVRTFTPEQAAALERLVSTHPDSQLAALVAA